MTAPPWLATLGVMFAVQAATSMLGRVAPTLAPVLMAHQGWTEGQVGAISSMGSLGSVLFLLAGLPVLRRYGPVRCLQIGLALGALGVLGCLTPLALALFGGLLVGMCFGPANSAGSEVLQHRSPPRHRNLIFSIKQSGVPFAGIFAGLALPWGAQTLGLVPVVLLIGVLTLAMLVLLQPLREGIDSHPDFAAEKVPAPMWRQVLALDNLLRPLRAIAELPRLRRLGLCSAALALSQGTWFTFLVTYLSLVLHWSLAAAGAAFAMMQVVSLVGRPALGWLSDRLGSGVPILRLCGAGSAATTLALAATSVHTPQWLVWLLIIGAGLTVSSWNGVQLAEVARCAPNKRISDVASGAMLLMFLSYVITPLWVGLCLAAGGSFALAFGITGVLTLGVLPALHGLGALPPPRAEAVASTQQLP